MLERLEAFNFDYLYGYATTAGCSFGRHSGSTLGTIPFYKSRQTALPKDAAFFCFNRLHT